MDDDLPYAGRFEGGDHLLPIRVYYEDTDATGIVYHANYIRYFERGRTDFIRLLGVSHSELRGMDYPVLFVVRKIEIEYFKPARVDEALVVRSRGLGMDGVRMNIAQSVERGGEVLARGVVQVVFIRPDGRPAKPPADVISRFRV
ncbi:MAG: YbgC/FadM family acyl-CoA thioesterase [Caulobacteraceae bacterium]